MIDFRPATFFDLEGFPHRALFDLNRQKGLPDSRGADRSTGR